MRIAHLTVPSLKRSHRFPTCAPPLPPPPLPLLSSPRILIISVSYHIVSNLTVSCRVNLIHQGFDQFNPLTFIEHALPVALGIFLCAAAHEAVRSPLLPLWRSAALLFAALRFIARCSLGCCATFPTLAPSLPCLCANVCDSAPRRSSPPFSLSAAKPQGHRFVASQRKIDLGPSFFIPNGDLGTFGAVTQIKSLLPGREDLFDVALAGPVAGGAVALGMFSFGLVASSMGAFVSRFGKNELFIVKSTCFA